MVWSNWPIIYNVLAQSLEMHNRTGLFFYLKKTGTGFLDLDRFLKKPVLDLQRDRVNNRVNRVKPEPVYLKLGKTGYNRNRTEPGFRYFRDPELNRCLPEPGGFFLPKEPNPNRNRVRTGFCVSLPILYG